MLNNAWFKLAAVSLVGIVISFAVLWGIGQFNSYPVANGTNYGYGYQYETNNGMNMTGMNGNMQGSMNMPGMNMNGSMQGGMNMNGNMQGMGMMNMQDMGMMKGMM